MMRKNILEFEQIFAKEILLHTNVKEITYRCRICLEHEIGTDTRLIGPDDLVESRVDSVCCNLRIVANLLQAQKYYANSDFFIRIFICNYFCN